MAVTPNAGAGTENDFPLGNPRSYLRRELDMHAKLVTRRHSLWVSNDRVSPLTGRRGTHFSWSNAAENAMILSDLTDPTAALFDPRMRRIIKALHDSAEMAGRVLGSQTDHVLNGVLASVLPILMDMAKAAAAGAIVGGAVGIFAGGGVGDEVTIPGGAIAGAEAAITILGYYGLARMLKEGGIHFGEFVRLVSEATLLAIFAGENEGFSGGSRGFTYDEDMRAASELYAAALGELWWIVLEAIIVWILKKAGEKAVPAAGRALNRAARSEALQSAIGAAKGQAAKFGNTFCDWLDRDFEKIQKSVEQHEKAEAGGDSSAGVQDASAAQGTRSAAKPPAAAASRVATDPDTAFFWSGRTNGVGGERVAAQYSSAAGGTTLEQLIESRGIQMPDFNPSDPASVKAWQDISAEYANGASGTVRAVVGQSLRPGNIWETSELPALMNNPNVTQIIQIDPESGAQTVIFQR